MSQLAPTGLTVSYNSRYSASIDDYFSDALWIWHRDAKERTVFDLWLHVVDHCSRLVEAVRKERPKEVIDDLANTFMWLLSFIAQTHQSKNSLDSHFRLEILPSDIIWNKYPARCPACFDYYMAQQIGAKSAEDAKHILDESRDALRNNIIKSIAETRTATPIVCECLSHIGFAE